MQEGQTNTAMQELLSENLKQADNLRLGQLENGLKYVMLPNKVPPQRFEAHLEMHAGTHAFIVISHVSMSICPYVLNAQPPTLHPCLKAVEAMQFCITFMTNAQHS